MPSQKINLFDKVLNRKARAASASGDGVGVLDFEFGAYEGVFEGDDAVFEEGHGDVVGDDGVFEDQVFVGCVFGEVHFILKAGTAAAIHCDAEFEGGFVLLCA